MLTTQNKKIRIEYYSSEAEIKVLAIQKPNFVTVLKAVLIGR